LAEVNYPGGQQTFDYDDAGRLITHKHFFTDMGPIPETLTYGYDRLGREIQCLHTDGTVVRRDLTANGWIRAIPGVVDEIDYDPRGLPNLIRYANGIHSVVTYTAGSGRVRTQKTTTPNGQVLENITYRHDLLEMLLESEDTSPQGAGTRRYAYDPLYQIIQTEASLGDGAATHTYEHSNFMNLTRFDEADCLMHYDDPAHPDRLAGITQGANPRFATPHDGNGNMLALPGRRFGYNAKNELASVNRDDGLVADYRYDHEGRRIAKTVTEPGGAVNRTFFVGDRADIQEGRRTVFVLLGSVRVAFITGAKTTFVHPDPLGGTAFFSDAAAVRIAVITYRPYGNMARSEGQIDRRTYGIHPFDAESGLFYMRKRYYAPEIGRFLSPDPLAIYQPTEYLHNPKALQVYAFVANDPLNRTDFTGLSFWSVVGAIVGVIAAVAVAALVVVTGGIAGVLLGIALAVGIVSVSYVVASANEGSGFGEFMRGFMIGFNAGLNAILASAVFGPGIGLALGIINFLAAFDTVANSAVYQGILGWSNWLMPMSWVATGIGLAFFVLNVIPAIFTLNQVNAVRIDSLSIDWGTGTIVTQGGWTFLPGFRGGFNLGNFTYITPGSGVRDHETGHTLSSAAFGSIFHFVGAIDENLVQSTPANAYAERIADSHDTGGPSSRAAAGERPIIPMWI
jgi:RHS repeat-associated protein